jgi:hypothetical protein
MKTDLHRAGIARPRVVDVVLAIVSIGLVGAALWLSLRG